MLCCVNGKSKITLGVRNYSYKKAAFKSKAENVTPTNKCVTFQVNNCQSYQTCMSWEVGGGATVYERSRGENIAQRWKKETDCSSKFL